jgi:hypothetical protein
LWDFLNAWAETARARLNNLVTLEGEAPRPLTSRRAPLLERWSADGGPASPIVLACADLSELIERPEPPPPRTRMLHFSAESLALLKERARQELMAAGDTAISSERGGGRGSVAAFFSFLVADASVVGIIIIIVLMQCA